MRELIDEESLEPIRFELGAFFTITFPRKPLYDKESSTREVDREVDSRLGHLSENQSKLLDLIDKDPYITKKQMSEILKIRSSSVDKNIDILKMCFSWSLNGTGSLT